MKKLYYALLAVAGVWAVKTILDRRERERLIGALPRPLPKEFNGEVQAAVDELKGPLAEI